VQAASSVRFFDGAHFFDTWLLTGWLLGMLRTIAKDSEAGRSYQT
jgi:hypothetical protein